jgi:hypothetical protein
MKRMLISSVAIGLAVQISSFCAAEERSEQDHSGQRIARAGEDREARAQKLHTAAPHR